MKVQLIPVDSAHADPANARRHPERNLEAIKGSLARFGQQKPIVVDGNGVVRAGNGTLEAAKALGWKNIAIVRTDLANSEATAFSIADNRSSELAEWNDEVLAATLQSLRDEEFDLEAIGFTDEEIEGLVGPEEAGEPTPDPGPQIDRAAELQVKWQTARGQLWEIGKHRLLCGDCTVAEDVDRAMNGEKALLMNTDPPYGVAVSGGTHDPRDKKNYQSGGTIQNDEMTGHDLQGFLTQAFECAAAVLHPGSAWYVWYAGTQTRACLDAVEALGGMRHVLVWVKPNFVFGRCDYHYRHEPVMYGWIPGAAHQWFGSRDQDSVFELKMDGIEEKLHPTVKPVELFTRPMLNHTKSGDVAYEPFAGSGSQFVAAEQTGRRCYGIEIEPKYCAVVLERLAGMGLEPRLESGPDEPMQSRKQLCKATL